MQPFGFALPGVSRLRTLQPLIDGDGACSLVYDVERAVVIEVPEELKHYAAPALESGNLDEELVGWLTSSDLLTSQDSWGWSGGEPDPLRLDAAAVASWGDGDDGEETHGWIDQQEAGAAIEAMERVWKRALGSPRIKLHLDWAGNFPAESWLEKVVADARRRAAAGKRRPDGSAPPARARASPPARRAARGGSPARSRRAPAGRTRRSAGARAPDGPPAGARPRPSPAREPAPARTPPPAPRPPPGAGRPPRQSRASCRPGSCRPSRDAA